MRARRLATALRAVSTSPVMPEWREYVARVEAMRPTFERTNLPGAALREVMREVVEARAPARGREVSAIDLLTALTSFADDYTAEPPRRLFAVDGALAILKVFEDRACLTADEQLDVALEVAGSTLLEAVLALHTATRVLARGRDSRVHPRLALDLDERLALGRAIAPFHPDDARGGTRSATRTTSGPTWRPASTPRAVAAPSCAGSSSALRCSAARSSCAAYVRACSETDSSTATTRASTGSAWPSA